MCSQSQPVDGENAPLIFVLGGARSGKSGYALDLAEELAGDQPRLFIATAQPGDPEMAERIERHRRERGSAWRTLEAPRQVAEAWKVAMAPDQEPGIQPAVALLDCVTLLVSNVFFADGRDPEAEDEAVLEAEAMAEVERLLATQQALDSPLVVVSNEVGMGIVPMGRISRLYRDVVGRVNRYLATHADHAILVVAGVPLDLNQLRTSLGPSFR